MIEIEILIRVVEGVHHAHQKGVVHRDLKPSNILVYEQDGRARPKIIDFGIAKAIEEPLTDSMPVMALSASSDPFLTACRHTSI